MVFFVRITVNQSHLRPICKSTKFNPKIQRTIYLINFQQLRLHVPDFIRTVVKRFNKIITHKYTTSRDVSSDIDGAIFFKEGYYYWYDLKKHVLHCMRSNLNMSSFNEAILFSGDSILIKEGCEIKKYKEKDFSQKSSLLTPTIIR